jgi:hypothetical protein
MEPDARLWIGSSDETGLRALFTDLATGRRIIIDATVEDGEWWAEMPLLVIGHTYRVELVTQTIVPVEFYPYVLTGTLPTSSTTLAAGVNVTVSKVWEADGDTYLSPDQWLIV